MAIKNLVRKGNTPDADKNRERGLSLQGRQNHPFSLFAGLEPFPQLRNDVNRLFDSYFGQDWQMPSLLSDKNDMRAFTPSIDVRDSGKEISIVAELPGMDENNIDVELNGDRLTIRGEKREEQDQNQEGWHRIERRFGRFERTILLPDGIDPENVEADYKNGVLSVTVPRRAEAQVHRRKIAIGGRSNGEVLESTSEGADRTPKEHKVA